MRTHQNALLALPALLSAFVVAAPSPASSFHHSLSAPSAQQQSLWKSLSNRVIASVWGVEQNKNGKSPRHGANPSAQPPPHTLARYGGDVVLRFNVSSAEETRALAEAADTLL